MFRLNGRSGRGPSQRSQSRPGGGAESASLPIPAGAMLSVRAARATVRPPCRDSARSWRSMIVRKDLERRQRAEPLLIQSGAPRPPAPRTRHARGSSAPLDDGEHGVFHVAADQGGLVEPEAGKDLAPQDARAWATIRSNVPAVVRGTSRSAIVGRQTRFLCTPSAAYASSFFPVVTLWRVPRRSRGVLRYQPSSLYSHLAACSGWMNRRQSGCGFVLWVESDGRVVRDPRWRASPCRRSS